MNNWVSIPRVHSSVACHDVSRVFFHFLLQTLTAHITVFQNIHQIVKDGMTICSSVTVYFVPQHCIFMTSLLTFWPENYKSS